MENLESVIESVVFVAGEAVSVSDLCVKFDVKPKEVEKADNAKQIEKTPKTENTKQSGKKGMWQR